MKLLFKPGSLLEFPTIANLRHCSSRIRPCLKLALPKKCPYLELFQSAFSNIRTEYGEINRISPYSVRMQETVD